MSLMLLEIQEMPARAEAFLHNSPAYMLPLAVPYIGMGSSYFAPLAFKYMGVNIQPELASEFYNYQSSATKFANAVLLSQSGKSSEVLWCTERFERFTAITNYMDSPLGKHAAARQAIDLLAGEETCSSSKTYINTLLALFKGFGIDATDAVANLKANMPVYEANGKAMADKVAAHLHRSQLSGIYITGSGPNIATALQAALILSESTRLHFQGMPMAQYDHGPKETAKGSMVIQILSKGPSYERGKKLSEKLSAAGAHVIEVEEPAATENESVLHNIIPFNFMAYQLSIALGIQQTFVVGGKVTEVE